MTPVRPSAVVALVLALWIPAAAARAQDETLYGTCEALMIAGQDLGASCKGSLLRLASPNFASFAFSAAEGRTLSFTGGGVRDTEAGSALPITLVAPGLTNKEGISRSPTPAVGACRITTPEPGTTLIACEATAQGKRYAGTFRARPSEAGGAKP